ncbi:MAG: GNAT family N-acetyltransferase, partial [Pyrinomonadaceae bacterium]
VVITEDNAPRALTPDSPRAHRVEFGYWLARPYWGQGIMTDAVRVFVRYAFSELGLLRLTAHVFESNIASARVLEKNGFKLEGHLREHFIKDGKLIDVRFYGLLKEDLAS